MVRLCRAQSRTSQAVGLAGPHRGQIDGATTLRFGELDFRRSRRRLDDVVRAAVGETADVVAVASSAGVDNGVALVEEVVRCHWNDDLVVVSQNDGGAGAIDEYSSAVLAGRGFELLW